MIGFVKKWHSQLARECRFPNRMEPCQGQSPLLCSVNMNCFNVSQPFTRPDLRFLAWVLMPVALLAASISPGFAQDGLSTARKPAWAWSLEERLAKRADPRDIALRAQRPKAQIPAQPGLNVIDGKRNPELLFPTELFDALLEDGFPSTGLDYNSRRHIDEAAAALGLGSDFWPRLQRTASAYLASQRDYEPLIRSKRGKGPESASSIKAAQLGLCHARAEALRAAKAEFGEELFLRLLYEGMAPNIGLEFSIEEGQAELWRVREKGCR
jgi:hypothetical protein